MALTKQDFEALAAIIRRAHQVAIDNNGSGAYLVDCIEVDIAEFAKQQNPRFDETKFAAACKPTKGAKK